jgi:hypothetical protein
VEEEKEEIVKEKGRKERSKEDGCYKIDIAKYTKNAKGMCEL